ncbi:MAG: N4-gp56 family major capsid protein [Xanthobacteraceae bacterium]|nr:N4-gp56 family major capsid protein [Xanthobacteraceae bacterium]
MQTVIPVGDPKAVIRFSAFLAADVAKKAYFERKFMGTSQNSIIQRLTDLEGQAGDTITFDLSLQLRKRPVYGDDKAEGKGVELRFATDTIHIDQMRAPIDLGGRMTRKRTIHNLREIGRERGSEYWAKFLDEMMFVYLSGARGINEDYIEDVTWTGTAGNSIQAPDTSHILYGGDATSKATIASDDVMSKAVIEKADVKAQMMRSTDTENATMRPSMVEGEGRYVLVMSPFQSHQLRNASSSDWVDFQKAAAAAEGKSNPLFKGGLGMIKNTVLHEHESVIRFSDYGTGSPGVLAAARALFLGRQAGICAFGMAGGTRFQWNEEPTDHKNSVEICAGTIIGVKKTRFKSRDFGVLAIDTYAPDPNA